MAQAHPNIKNVAWAGFSDPTTVGATTDAMLTQHPDLDGIYVSWSGGPATRCARIAQQRRQHPHQGGHP